MTQTTPPIASIPNGMPPLSLNTREDMAARINQLEAELGRANTRSAHQEAVMQLLQEQGVIDSETLASAWDWIARRNRHKLSKS